MTALQLHVDTGRRWSTLTPSTFRASVTVDGVPHVVTLWTTSNGKMHVKADDARETTFGLPGMTAHTIDAFRRAILAVDPTNAGYSYVADAARIRAGFKAICKALDIMHPWND